MKEILRKSVAIGIIAGILVLLDGIITKKLNIVGSFTWGAFVSWTVFFGESIKERLKAIVGYVIVFLSAVAIIKLGNLFGVIPFNIFL